jgi:antitoxin (DNA-binding transcriptional repressor) of toxin-antitoxin stability system
MEKFTVEQFQERFDELIGRVENGETFEITDGKRKAILIPYGDLKETDELIRIYTDHEEGS